MSTTLTTAGADKAPANTPKDNPMTAEQAQRLEEKLDRLAPLVEMLPIIEALGRVVIRRQTAVDRTGMSKNTLAAHPAFEEIGKRKTFIEIGEIAVVKQRKRHQS